MPTPPLRAAAECAATVQGVASSNHPPTDGVVSRNTRFIAWKVGFGFGFAVGLERAGVIDAAQRQQSIQPIQPLSEALGGPIPALPPPGPTARALPEYGQLVEDDVACTAALL